MSRSRVLRKFIGQAYMVCSKHFVDFFFRHALAELIGLTLRQIHKLFTDSARWEPAFVDINASSERQP